MPTHTHNDTLPMHNTTHPVRLKRLFAATLLAAASLPVRALTIHSSFDVGYNDEQKSTIAHAISYVESQITDDVAFSINFHDSPTGLGSSYQSMYASSYSSVVSRLNAHRSSAADYLAMSNVSTGAADPATGQNALWFTYAQCFALGFDCGAQDSSDIYLNLDLVDPNAGDGIAADKYDMYGVALHEIDEFLGLGGPGSTVGSGLPFLGIEDLFRYASGGTRSYTTSGDDAYFSIDGGASHLARFNQMSGGDYADWWSNGPHAPSVQDAFGTPGASYSGYSEAERTVLDVVGWNMSTSQAPQAQVPEPPTVLLMLPALLGLGLGRGRGLRGRPAKRPA